MREHIETPDGKTLIVYCCDYCKIQTGDAPTH